MPAVPDGDRVLVLDEPAAVMTGHQTWVSQAGTPRTGSGSPAAAATGASGCGTRPMVGRSKRVLSDGILGLCSVAFSPDGTQLAVSDVTRGVLVFTLDVDELAAIANDRLIRTWTQEQCRKHLDTDVCPRD